MKHYEDLWVEAEKLSQDLKQEVGSSISAAIAHLEMLKNCPENMRSYHMGMLIFNTCAISQVLNVNTFPALQKVITDKKSETFDPDEPLDT